MNSTRSNGRAMENEGFTRDLQPGMEDDTLTSASSDNSAPRTSEIAPLQLESHNTPDKSTKGMQDGLKVIITSSIFFAISVTVALILTIYLAPPQVSQHAAVVSDSRLCSSTGEQLLRRGGSAVDAAIAVVLCEGLVNPHHSGIGGGGFMVVRRSKSNTTHVIDFMDSAPAELSVRREKMTDKGLTVGVPGMLRGLEMAHEKFGKLRWIDVIMPVVELAFSPVNISSELARHISEEKTKTAQSQIFDYFKRIRQSMPENQMNLTGLGWLLQSVAKEGADAFYDKYAEEIVEAVVDKGGVMTKEDLTNYTSFQKEPVRSTFLNMAVESVSSPGGGPLLLLFLNMMENLTADGVVQWNSTNLYHFIVEALKFTLAHWSVLGDSDFAKENITSLITSKNYASNLTSQVDEEKTHQNADYYSPDLKSPFPSGTSQISVIDPNDDMVSMTVSLNGPFGSGLVTESGIILNSHMLNFDNIEENQNNVVEPGKRPLVPLSPTIIYNPRRSCGHRFALGGANGDSLIAGLAEVILNIFGLAYPLHDAVEFPRLSVQFLQNGDIINHEAKFPAAILHMLKEKQHDRFHNATGGISVVHVVAKVNETVYGEADSRTGSEAVIY